MDDLHAIKAVELSSKKVLWEVELGAEYAYSPIFDNGMIFLSTGGISPSIYSIDQTTGKINWKKPLDVLSNLYLTVDKIYFISGDSRLTVLDKLSGNEILNVKISPNLDLNEPNGSYFVSGDSTNKILALYFGDNDQIIGLKIKSP